MEKIGSNGSRGGEETARPVVQGRRRAPWALVVVAVLFVVVPFLTWYWTWFGRTLSDSEIESYLRDGNARHAQHALSQVAERIEERQRAEKENSGKGSGKADAGRWYPQVVALSKSDAADLRMT